MAQDSELLTKMDALLKKHQPGARYKGGATEVKDAQAIPTLTEMVIDPSAEEDFERNLIPVLTAVVEEMKPAPANKPAEIELDFDFDVDFSVAPDGGASPAIPEYEPPPHSAKAVTVALIPEAGLAPVESIAGPEYPPEAPPPISVDTLAPQTNSCSQEQRLQISDAVAEKLLHNLQLQIPGMLERTIMPQLVAALDREISSLIDQIVRDAVACELEKQFPEIQTPLANPDKPPSDPV
jgi:hypothetical protein